jgi:hypothetical protein
MNPPAYFSRVAASATGLREKLKDPVLAGPWRQLFAQVQSSRRVLMEIDPDSIALVLRGDGGEPCEWRATELHELNATGQVYLHQSRFILKQQPN